VIALAIVAVALAVYAVGALVIILHFNPED
jgi:hypothetical protein